MKKKRILAVCILIALAVSLLPINVFAALENNVTPIIKYSVGSETGKIAELTKIGTWKNDSVYKDCYIYLCKLPSAASISEITIQDADKYSVAVGIYGNNKKLVSRPTSYDGTTSEYVDDKTVISYVTGSQFRGEGINTNAYYSKFVSKITGNKEETLSKISTNPKTKGYGAMIQVKSGKSAYDKPMIVVQFEDEYTGIDTAKLEAAIKRCKVYNDKLSGYTEKTANAYRIALDNAESYLASLFDDDGTPTAENVKTNQSKADGYADALDEATAELARTLDRYGSVSLALDAIPALCELADEAVSNTALNGRNELKAARDAAYAVWQKYKETQLNLNASEYREIRTAYRELFDAYYLGLTNTAESITVNVRVTDTASLQDPDFYHVDSTWTSTTWTGSVTLTGDQTLGALETQLGSKLYNKGRQDGFGAVSYAALINCVYPHSVPFS